MATNEFHTKMGIRIAHCRKAMGYTQEQLAEQMDVSTQTISYIETGRNAIRPENLARLCEVLQVSSDYILLGRSSPIEANRIAGKLTSLSMKKMEAIEAIIDNCLSLSD